MFIIVPICLLSLLALRFFGSPLSSLGDVYYVKGDTETAAQGVLGYFWEDYARVDFLGGQEEMYKALDKISAKQIMSESVGELTIVYAYSPRVFNSVTVNGLKVNVMAATDGITVHIGTPLLKGSF